MSRNNARAVAVILALQCVYESHVYLASSGTVGCCRTYFWDVTLRRFLLVLDESRTVNWLAVDFVLCMSAVFTLRTIKC